MKIKNECEIVKDLFPSYIEKLLSNDSEGFIEKHLENCSECRNILQILKKEKNENIDKVKFNDKIEYKYLKKINKKILLLKSVIIIILLVIFIIFGLTILKLNYLNNVITTTYNNIQDLKKVKNYSISIEQHQINYINNTEFISNTKYYFLNDTYKEDLSWYISYENTENPSRSYYGKINSNKRIEIYDDTKKIINSTTNYNYETEASFINRTYSDFNNYSIFGGFSYIYLISGLKIRNDRFSGKECYVLKSQSNSKEGFKEIWIEKDTMLPIRIVEDIFNNQYNEKNIICNTNVVKEIDIEIPNKEGYLVENNNTNVDETAKEVIEQFNQ